MAYFHCLIGGGSSGGGYELTVTCDADFAGTTITCTDGVTTLTQTCPSSSPYEVVFAIPNGGEWTISGIISGQTYSTSIDIPDEVELIAIPDGSTVTPTDVIQTWLKCGGIFDKSYTTVNEVLADSTTLLALMSDDNAVDYLVRSTTWASGITADSTAMTDIGANNYCANTLLADSTWLDAISDSTYFESVLNVKAPRMTSNTTPSGEAFELNGYGGDQFAPWRAFDEDASTYWASYQDVVNSAVGYKSTSKVVAYFFDFAWSGSSAYLPPKIQIQGSNDNFVNDINVLGEYTGSDYPTTETKYRLLFESFGSYQYHRCAIVEKGSIPNFQVAELQFYGRVDV